jgi:formamidopyrimidine-DNA glycosylase
MSILFADIMGLSAAPVGVELQTNVAEFFQAFDSPICEVLLDQQYFNGIGNYLRAEILGRAGINVHFVSSYLSLSVCVLSALLYEVYIDLFLSVGIARSYDSTTAHYCSAVQKGTRSAPLCLSQRCFQSATVGREYSFEGSFFFPAS